MPMMEPVAAEVPVPVDVVGLHEAVDFKEVPVAVDVVGPQEALDLRADLEHREEWYKSNLRGVTVVLPGAALGLDVNTTGNPNFVVIGTDLNGDGIPDALQYGAAKLALGGCLAAPPPAAF